MNIFENQNINGVKNFQIVSFTVGKEEYGVHINDVQEIIRIPEITHLPQTQHFIKGVINLRGNIIPVIEMRERFKMETAGYNDMTRVIIVRSGEKLIGMIVDTVSQVLEMNDSEIEEAPDIINGLSKDYIEGIGKINDTMIIILKIAKVTVSEEIVC